MFDENYKSTNMDIKEGTRYDKERKYMYYRVADADIVIVVIDSSVCKDIEKDVRSMLSWCDLKEETPVLLALNKCDLLRVQESMSLPWPAVSISCTSGEGINSLVSSQFGHNLNLS